MTPQELVERALDLSETDGCVAITDVSTKANLRWANNTLTTNGVTRQTRLTVVATTETADGVAVGVVTRSAVTPAQVEDVVRMAEKAARDSEPADDAQPLIIGEECADWEEPSAETSISVFTSLSPALGEAFGRARADRRVLYGFVEHDVTTTYLGSSTGLRLRHTQPTGYVTITGKTADLQRSAWVGQTSQDFTDVDALTLDAELARRLRWSERQVDLPAGRYDTILPPTAVADLLVYLYWAAGARDAHEGRTVFSNAGSGTKVGERLSPHPVTLRSDPSYPGLECVPFAVAHTSSAISSVFDNGLELAPTDWIRDGELTALQQTRHSADMTGLAVTPAVDNLVLEVGGAAGSIDDLVAQTERGLLLTCLWYIREVDPQTLLLTGLTRDGVYLVENGEVTGAVNNFRFNESPVDLLARFSAATGCTRSFSRECGPYFPRTATPALQVPDFNMSSVSQAS